ncbi:hypothetical protein H0I29_15590 [Polaribacter sp. R2A056_3_33]|uniref:hypothetical protein n=1 Tax=Polaribacter sp. R2A056_3_33 TaxID=2745563 RepID=UPI001C4FE65B|nr:hypothetical protein [Polaribacter sp. R2A056_3_33]QXP70020.1 hypothetical protein H0I29_15590 [Polaribacter sp. R2A056_3_33]
MKLFRKIRRNLIDLRKFKSYALYALGEIILIVIAVSIAWKINDLSDIQKNNSLVDEIYTNLHDELTTNLRLLKRSLEENTETITSLENTLNYVGKNTNELTQGAKDTILNVAVKEVNLQDSSVKSILSTAKLELIESSKLKDLIATYLTKIEQFNNQDKKNKNIVENKIKPTLEKFISLIDMLPDNDLKYKHIKEFGNKSDYKTLLATKEYQNSIIDRLLQTKIQLGYARTLHSKTKILITKLQEEIE